MTHASTQSYKTTESQYKGGAEEMYVTYDLWQETWGEGRALYPKVKRVYIAGRVKDWHVGTFAKRSGKHVYGVKIEYDQSRTAYARKGYTATRGSTQYRVAPTQVYGGAARFSKIVEVPQEAHNIQFQVGELPSRYRGALQDVR
jgi:hypothetical protein